MRYHKKNKKGFEVAIGFIVILIITVIIFTSSIFIIRQFFGTTSTIEESLTTESQQQIERLLGAGQRVAVVPQVLTAVVGKQAVSGAGIYNTGSKETFYVLIGFVKAFDADGTPLNAAPEVVNKWLLYSSGPYEIKKAERIAVKILASPGAYKDENPCGGTGCEPRTVPGTYVFNVCVVPSVQRDGMGNIVSTVINANAITDADKRAKLEENCASSSSTLPFYTGQRYKLQVVVE